MQDAITRLNPTLFATTTTLHSGTFDIVQWNLDILQ